MADCTAGKHGDHNAYMVDDCRCPEARESYRLYRKQLREDRRPAALVDKTGTVRRLQALAAIGWSPHDLAERLDCRYTQVQQLRGSERPRVQRQIAEKVAAIYEELQGTPGGNEKARAWAEKLGWAAPLAWDDDAIDNPAAQPERDEPVQQRGVDLAEVRFLESCRESREQIAKQLGVRLESIERAEFRAAERARDTVPVWVPAHQMGDAHALAR